MNDPRTQLRDKANRSIHAAKRLLADGDYDFAVSRAYYALFYLAELLLLTKGKTFSKHAAVISGVYAHFIKTNELPKTFHQTLHQAFELRSQGDYLTSHPITHDVAHTLIADIHNAMAIARDLIE